MLDESVLRARAQSALQVLKPHMPEAVACIKAYIRFLTMQARRTGRDRPGAKRERRG